MTSDDVISRYKCAERSECKIRDSQRTLCFKTVTRVTNKTLKYISPDRFV